MRHTSGMISAAAALALAAVGGWSHQAPAKAQSPWVKPHALAGVGRVAFVWRGDVWVWGSGLSAPRDLGSGVYPMWSPNGRSVAFLREPFAESRSQASLWVAQASGTPREVQSSTAVGLAAWAPSGDRLVVATAPTGFSAEGRPEGPAELWAIDVATGARRLLEKGTFVTSLAVGNGKVVYSITLPGRTKAGRTDGLYAAALIGGPPRRIAVAPPGDGIQVASVQTGRVQYWLDPLHSASLAADGLPLDSVPLSGGRSVRIATTLTYTPWLAHGRGDTVDLISGDLRLAWTHKSLTQCDLATGRCRAVYGGASRVATDPAVSANGRIVLFVTSQARGNRWGFSNPNHILSWAATRQLWAWRPGTQPLPVRGAPSGAYDPAFTADPHDIVLLAKGGLWLVNRSTGRSSEVIGGFLPETPDAAVGYYGYRSDIPASYAFSPTRTGSTRNRP